jgi:acetyl-CoA acetyltransferase
MVANIKDKSAIVGIGNTEFSKNSGVSELQLACEAIKSALDDAGLAASDIDGMATFTMDNSDEIEIARALGCNDLTFYARTPYGGGAATGLISQAAMAIATGMAETVVVYRALNGRSGHRYSAGVSGQIVTADAIHWGWYTPFGLLTPASWVAMYAQRWMALTGTTKDALFEVAQSTREYAANNPAAFFYQQRFDRAEYDAQKKIAGPLSLYDCCQESDGGSALILTTPERAEKLKHAPVMVKGVAQVAAKNQEQMTSFYDGEIINTPEMDKAAELAYEMAGMSADDIDAAILYDAFTPTVLWQLESWGFAEHGKAGEFALSGALRSDGRLPTNTNGGQLSEAYIHGVNGIVEAVKLVRGTSVNQPKKAVNNVLVTAGVGVPTGGAILGKME